MKCLFLLCFTIIAYCYGDKDELPDGISRALYCTGCELTVKAIHRDLSQHTGEDMNSRIDNVLNKICNKDYLNTHETGAETLVKICKDLIKKYKKNLHPFLKEFYSGKSRKGESYLCISHKICSHVTPACKGYRDESSAEAMQCDHEDEDFLRHFEKNAKTKKVNPVHESVVRDKMRDLHEEL